VALADVARELAAHDDYLVTAHVNPDGDAVASLLGMVSLLRAMGKRCVAVCQDPVPERYRFLPRWGEIQNVEEARGHGPFRSVVVLDAGEFDRIGEVKSLLTDEMPVINIDHHISNPGFGAGAWVDTTASATAEMLHALFRHFKLLPDSDTAMILYVGIMTDTGRFRFSNTSSRAFATVAALVERGADPAYAAEKVYHNTDIRELKILGNVLQRMQVTEDGRIATSYLTLDEADADSEGFVDHVASVRGIEVAALLKQVRKDYFKVSFRSANEINVSDIAGVFGGGGHRKAAGARLEGNLEEVRRNVVEACERALADRG